MNREIAQNINSLPALSKSIVKIQKIYNDPDSGVSDLAKAIGDDPMIVANLFKEVNSPIYNFDKKIDTVSQAVAMLGMSMTRSIVFANSLKKLLNIDMEPYAVSSEVFADISSKQARLIYNWYKQIDKVKADKLFLSALLQETGKILIASQIIKNNELLPFRSEIETSYNIALIEKSFVQTTTAEVTAEIFEHWGFDQELIQMIRYSDEPAGAPQDVKEFSTALNIVKTIIAVNHPFSETAINYGLKKALDAGYEHEILEDVVDDML